VSICACRSRNVVMPSWWISSGDMSVVVEAFDTQR
jgi:hypothetical protein